MAAAPTVLKDAYLSIGGTDWSDWVTQITLNHEYEEQEVTAMGDTARHGIPGMQASSIEVEMNMDYTDNMIDEMLYGIVGSATASAIIVKPASGATSAANPKWTGNGRVYAYPAIQGAVGDVAKVSFTIKPGDGSGFTRAVSD
jgi:hypothetical protein